MTQPIDLELAGRVYRRRRRYMERREIAKPAYDAAYRRAWSIGLPMSVAAQVALVAAFYVSNADLGAASLMLVLYLGLRDLAPKPPDWSAHLAAVPEYD